MECNNQNYDDNEDDDDEHDNNNDDNTTNNNNKNNNNNNNNNNKIKIERITRRMVKLWSSLPSVAASLLIFKKEVHPDIKC